jgi:SAM-dependent methyltransferase
MARFRFVADYERLVARLVRSKPLDEAMEAAVGGGYEIFGGIETGIVRGAGLRDGMRLIDLGCGSGRLASALQAQGARLSYVGIDIVKSLLEYAKKKAPGYEFILHRDLSIPQPDASADMVSAFSLFTHMLHEDTYAYLEECVRVLKPGGTIVFSFLEFAEPAHWAEFMRTRAAAQASKDAPLNVFIERGAIEAWASRLGVHVERYVDASFPSWQGHALGQSVAILAKRGARDGLAIRRNPEGEKQT